MKFKSSDIVALSGFANYPKIKLDVLTFLELHHIKNTILSPKIAALIIGPSISEDKYKIKYAKSRKIPILTIEELYKSIEIDNSSIETALWIDKYKPTKITQIIGNGESIKEIYNWLKNWKCGIKPNAILVTGPPGIGKSSSIAIIAQFTGYDIVELNASNQRSAKLIRQVFDETYHSRYIGKKYVFIMDEVDGMSTGDHGGMAELIKVIDKSPPAPIICIANDRGSPKIKSLSGHCLDIKYQRPPKATIAKKLYDDICIKEHINISLKSLEEICEYNGNDIRQIINYLQFASISPLNSLVTSQHTKDEILRMDIFSATSRLFNVSNTIDERINYTFIDSNMIPLRIQENYIAAANRTGCHLNTIVKASQYISTWDLIDTRIHEKQAWMLMPDACAMTVAAASSCRGSPSMQMFPQWLGKNSKTNKHRRHITDIMHRTGSSALSDYYDYIDIWKYKLYAQKDAIRMCDTLEDLHLTRDDLLETFADLSFTLKHNERDSPPDTKLKAAITREWRKRHPLVAITKSSGKDTDANDNADIIDDSDSDSDSDIDYY